MPRPVHTPRPELIFMLTQGDRTVPEPLRAINDVRTSGLRHVGFKDVGLDDSELESLVDSGASATVDVKGQVRAVKASEPDPNRWYNMADGNIIQNRGEKLFRA